MRKVLFMIFGILLAGLSQACASAGYTGLTGLSVPGFEAAGVVAGNQTMVASIAGQQGWLAYGQQFGYPNVPICRLQDLVGLPPINVVQPVLVRVPKSRGHRAADILGAATVVGGIAYINTGYDLRSAAVGAGTGAGGGLLVANHEPADLCLLLPVKAAP